ncbi:hypothetical protein [uncultured Winogradskyella sp.]|uniref:hypothetical protein n=1 Tax=uncultured Winogradskyella sp. TaxID=395353 RepID=UPI0026040163|nr:hypothetical protein [uncultured Winogradskyella sp.]
MKNHFIVYLLLVITSCSNESIDTNEEVNNQELTNYIFKTYNVGNDPNTIILERNFTIENDKIISSINTSTQSNNIVTTEYTYENNRISEVSRYIDGSLISIKNFTYNNEGNLSEYLNENIDSNQDSFYNKISFIHTADTIYGISNGSEDGINFDINFVEAKIVLDTNKNKTYQEIYDVNNDETSYTEYTYDSNNNILTSNKFEEINGTFFSVLSFSYTYENTINTLARIYEETYGRELLMLLNQHRELNTSALNYYDTKYITTNCFQSVTSSFFGNNLSAEFTSTANEDNYSTYSDYKTLDSGSTISRFSYDFIFE